ncbi:MAG: DinB family protein [Anaerolineae bacterium]|nr:DinB family protein [Anaerolineae bacterium]
MYIGLLPDDGLVLEHLQDNLQTMCDFVRTFPKEKLTTRWAEGEWTIKEILVHIIDDERIYSYRTLRFARGDSTELPGFEQDEYVPYSKANERDLEDILEEYSAVRQATITLFRSFDDAALLRAGVSNGHIMSVRAAAYHIAGHDLHHFNSIKENYGTG